MSSGCSPTPGFPTSASVPSKSQVPSQISRSRPQPTGQRGATAIVMLAQVWAATCRATTRAVPLLQQRCAFRTERSGATRPEHLGLSG